MGGSDIIGSEAFDLSFWEYHGLLGIQHFGEYNKVEEILDHSIFVQMKFLRREASNKSQVATSQFLSHIETIRRPPGYSMPIPSNWLSL